MTDLKNIHPSEWGSDAFARVLADLDLGYIALNPGASYRGLHDSLVNFTGDTPQILLCVHEEAAVSIAQGWAKVTRRAMGVALHSNVGLMHASMSIYNAWCDRVPMTIVGATGPVDAMQRRPWIDWIHTSQDQGALVRDFLKWDDQPGSIAAACHALAEGTARAETVPQGPVYINLDTALQEKKLTAPVPMPDIERIKALPPAKPDPELIAKAVDLLKEAERPVILMGRVSQAQADWDARVALVERLGAQVLTDFKVPAAFPTAHAAQVGPAGYFPGPEAQAALAAADVIVNLDWVDFAGTLRAAQGGAPLTARIISATPDAVLQRGWVRDSGAMAPADLAFQTEPDAVVAALNAGLGVGAPAASPALPPVPEVGDNRLSPQDIAALLRRAVGDRAACLTRAPLSWTGADWPVSGPLDMLGYDGGGGLGSGPGMAVGAALALRDRHSGRLPLAVLGDGDFLMNASALWTAVRYKIPLLIVVVNNHSFYNDEVHQESVARERNRPLENKTIGITMDGPDIDISEISRGFGARSFGRVEDRETALTALKEAIEVVDAGGVAVVEVEAAKGYAPSMTRALSSDD